MSHNSSNGLALTPLSIHVEMSISDPFCSQTPTRSSGKQAFHFRRPYHHPSLCHLAWHLWTPCHLVLCHLLRLVLSILHTLLLRDLTIGLHLDSLEGEP